MPQSSVFLPKRGRRDRDDEIVPDQLPDDFELDQENTDMAHFLTL